MNHNTPEATGLDPAVLRDELMGLWAWRDLQTLHISAVKGFSNLSEPLEALLTILESCPNKSRGRSQTINNQILMEFQKWMVENPQVNLSSLPEEKAAALQKRALSLLTDTHPSFTDSLINVYQLTSYDKDGLLLHITNLQDLNCYKEAAALGIKLNLQNELDMEKMCIPLILQDKFSLAEAFVTGHKDLEEQLLILLDSWCHPNFSVDDLTEQLPGLSITRNGSNQVQPKLLTKHIFRLVEKFKADQGKCPNALHKRKLDSLRFLMYKTFVEKSMTEENWSDHVQHLVEDSLELQVLLVEMLVRYSGLQKASQWSSRYNIPRYRLPVMVWETQQTLPTNSHEICLNGSVSTEDWVPSQSHQQMFYQVPLTQDKVHFVDTLEALRQCQSTLLQEGAVVGIDMEWLPTFGCISAQQVALIQLAVSDQVFLLDLCASGFGHHPQTINFIKALFSAPKVLKLGYAMASGDLKCLSATWQELLEEPLKMVGLLDLLNIQRKIQRNKVNRIQNGPKQVLVGEGSVEKGLSLLVRRILGRPLDKTEQMSNWEKRPLRISQIRYAVADAYCLLELYSVLSTKPANFGLPADLHSISSNHSEPRTDKKTKEKQSKATKQDLGNEECQGAQRVSPAPSDTEKSLLCGEKPSEARPPLPPQQLRVVCDNMLQGLGRYLRCVGVDVVMLDSSDDHRMAAKLAQEEGRVILTCGQPFQSLRSQVGEGRCISLQSSEKARDQAIRILRYFNIQPTPGDIFSRCQACNGDQYAAIPREYMVRMLKQKGFLQDDAEYTSDETQEEGDKKANPGLPRYALQCRWASISDLDPETLCFPGGSPVQVETVPPGLLPKISLFYGCTKCGKVFWEGSHFGRVLSMFQEVLNLTPDDAKSAAEPTSN